jgi:hypothetical protein
MVRECAQDECVTLTMGRYCLEHELLMAAATPVAASIALTVDDVESGMALGGAAIESPAKQTVPV